MFAGIQAGNVSTAQLEAAGLDRRAVRHRVNRGALHPVCSRVYSVLPGPWSWDAHSWAALLSGGDEAVLNSFTAAALDGLLSCRTSRRIDLAHSKQRRSNSIFLAHHITNLAPQDVRTLDDGRRITTWARTALDVAAESDIRTTEILLNRAIIDQKFDVNALSDLQRRTPGHHGHKTLKAAIRALDHGCTLTDSQLEEAFLAIVDAAGLPRPISRVYFGELRIDFYWPGLRLAVEVDSAKYHRNPDAHARDGRKDLHLAQRHVHLIHIADFLIEHEPAAVGRTLVAAYTERARLLAAAA